MKIVYSKELKNQEYIRLIIQEDAGDISVWGVDSKGLNWFIIGAETLPKAKKELNRWIKDHTI